MNALDQLFETSFTSRLCVALLHSLWQIGLVAIALWVSERLTIARSVEARYKVHVIALLLAIAAVPLTFLLIGGSPESAVRSVATVPAAEFDTRPVTPHAGPAQGQALGQQAAERSPAYASQVNGPAAAALPASVTRWIAAVYALGVLLMLARLLRGMWFAQRMVSRARSLTDGPLVAATRRLAERWKLASLPRLAMSDALAMPCVTGLLRPTIVFPLAALSGMSPAEMELILVHELAHVRRHDLWIHLLQRVAEAVLFFNPGLWYLSRRLSILREYCCDELACSVPAPSTESTRLQYAAALVHSAELQLARTGRFSASSLAEIGALAAAGSSPSELRRRVARILDEPLREPLLLSRSGVAAFVALVVALVLAPAAVYSGSQDPNAGLDEQQIGSSEKQRTAEPEVSAAQPDPFTRTLKSGAEVKVLGIGTRNQTPERWWHPDGKSFEGVPYHVKDNERYTFPGPVTREVAYAIENVPEDASFRIDTNPPATNWGEGGVTDADGDRLAHHYGRIFSLASDVRTFELKVGVAIGEWETVATCKPSRAVQAPIAANGVIFSGPFSSDLGHRQIVTVSHELQNQDTRLVVVGKEGRIYPTVNLYRESAGKNVRVAQFDIHFPAELIDHLEFQARDYEWASFDNLPVEPKPDKNAKATISGRIVLADGSPHRGAGSLYYLWSDGAGSRSDGLLAEGIVDQFTAAVLPGKVWLKYFSEGFAPAWAGPFALTPGARMDGVTLTLDAGFSATLRVTSDTGEPIANAQVVALPTIGDACAGPSVPMSTGSDGRFELTHLADIPYTLNAHAPGYQTRSDQQRRIRPGEIVTLELKKARLSSGVVVDASGQPLAGATISLRVDGRKGGYATQSYGFAVKTDEQGRFTLDQLTDDNWYQYVVKAKDGAKVAIPLLQAGESDIRVTVPPRIDLRIRVVGDISQLPQRDGRPSLGIRAPYKFEPAKSAVTSDLLGEHVFVTPTAEGGHAEYRGLIPGDVEIEVGNQGYPFGRITESQEITLQLKPLDTPTGSP